MPRGNGTGPNGMGPMTGRGAGYCAGYNVPGFANPGATGGFGGGFGGGRGWRNRFFATGLFGGQRTAAPFAGGVMDETRQRAILQQRKSALEAQLKEVNDALGTETT